MNKISKMKECPECGSLDIIYNKRENELICKDCGLIYTEFIETMPLEQRPIKKMVGAIKKKHEEIKSRVLNKPVKKEIIKKAVVKKPIIKAAAKKPIAKPVKHAAVKHPAKKIIAKAKPIAKKTTKLSNRENARSAISSILGRFRR